MPSSDVTNCSAKPSTRASLPAGSASFYAITASAGHTSEFMRLPWGRKREEIAAQVALELGLGALTSLTLADRAAVERQTDETIEGCDSAAADPSDCTDAD